MIGLVSGTGRGVRGFEGVDAVEGVCLEGLGGRVSLAQAEASTLSNETL